MRPLDRYKVVDLTIWVQGPLASQLLADLGATVLKIERLAHGDFSRGLSTLFGAPLVTDDNRNLLWELCNRNKKSIAIDLRSPDGRAVFRRLITDADVFVTNLQPSTLASFEALPSQLLALNPTLVYAIGAGLGTRERFADVPSQDTAGMAYSGFMYTASADEDEPFYPPGAIADVLAGTNLAFGVVAALLARDHDRRARLVTSSLLQSMMWAQMLNIGVPANNGQRLRRFERTRVVNPLMNIYRCQDNRWIALGMVSLGNHVWASFCQAIERPELLDDPRFATPRLRVENAGTIVEALDAIFAQAPLEAWLQRFRPLDIPCSPVNRPEDLVNDAGVHGEGLIAMTRHGLRFVRSPFTIENTDVPEVDAPELGRDTFSTLQELGFSAEEVAELQQANVIW